MAAHPTDAEQGALVPNRRAQFAGMSINELEEPLPFGAEVTLIVKGTVTGEGREKRKDGTLIHTAKVTVGNVRVTEVEEATEPPTLFAIKDTGSGPLDGANPEGHTFGDEDELEGTGAGAASTVAHAGRRGTAKFVTAEDGSWDDAEADGGALDGDQDDEGDGEEDDDEGDYGD